ncbi:hypothetical protein KCTC32420_01492 [Aequorivita nionensis]
MGFVFYSDFGSRWLPSERCAANRRFNGVNLMKLLAFMYGTTPEQIASVVNSFAMTSADG